MKDGTHGRPDGLGIVEVGTAFRERDPCPEGVRGADDGADVSGLLHTVQQYDPLAGAQQLLVWYVHEREDPYRTGRGRERRETPDLFPFVEHLSGWLPGFPDQGHSFSQKESLGLAVFFGVELRRALEGDHAGGTCPRRLSRRLTHPWPPCSRLPP